MTDSAASEGSNEQGSIRAFLLDSVVSLEDVIDQRWRRLKTRFGWNGKPQIVAYTGYASATRAWFHGRVLTNPPKDSPDESDSWWDNLVQTYTRFESDEVPGVDVEITHGNDRHVVTTDKEGYFHLEAASHHDPLDHDLWKSIAMRIVNHDTVPADASLVTARLLTPKATAVLGVISDIDDTILHTNVLNLKAMVKHTFFHNARTRLPLAGVGALYDALGKQTAGEPAAEQTNPIFYVSSSPWNLHDLLEDFLDLNAIPHGPILLRDLGLDRGLFSAGSHDHKLEKASRILSAFPDLPFVLFGDSGQEDARLYATAAERHGEQIRAIFIRDVDPDFASHRDDGVDAARERAEAAGVPMFLVVDSVDAATKAVDLGLLRADELPAIEAATQRDLQRAT